MLRALLLAALLGGSLACGACSSSSPTATPAGDVALPEDGFDRDAVAAHLRFLAADELLGRRAGTSSADVAARYIAEQFRAAGVEPVPGLDGYLQTFEMPRPEGAPLVTSNVVGVVHGTDPARRDEYILLTAHYDHVGASSTHRGATPADSIFNGARDNAMGTTAVIMAGRALAARPAARSVLLVAFTAEEMGLLGSRYLAANPPVPLGQMVFLLNIDNGGYSDTTAVVLIGHGRTTADEAIAESAERYGLTLHADPAPEQGLFNRSDNAPFARIGIPAPTFTAGFHAFSDPGVRDYYHQPADEADDFDFAYLKRFAQTYAHAARLLANQPTRPYWLPGDEFESAARDLYGEE